ncbi:MAG TPA: DUF3024 domain-containing protein [Nitrospirota bacterium]
MQPKRTVMFQERVIRDLERMFPNPEPDKHRYVIETATYSFYLYDYRPDPEGSGEWVKAPVAKFSFHDGEQVWQVSWMPPQGRWQKYGRYFDLDTASLIIKADPAGCFMGNISPLAYAKQKDAAGPDDKPEENPENRDTE